MPRRFAARLQQQKAGLLARFRPLQSRPLLAYHDAWHYFDHAMGLNYRGSLNVGARTKSREHSMCCRWRIVLSKKRLRVLLTEPGADMALAQRIFGAQAFRTAVVDELFASTRARGPQGYEAGLAGMAASIQGLPRRQPLDRAG
jgi:ABC-type Zn2+ transport system substrate-binding protein/surface adhesin